MEKNKSLSYNKRKKKSRKAKEPQENEQSFLSSIHEILGNDQVGKIFGVIQKKSNNQKHVKENSSDIIQRKIDLVNQRISKGGSSVKTDLPNNIRNSFESFSGIDLSDVKVHRNSPKPLNVSAHAYTQGSNIYVAPGQEKHLAHEAWHVVQQKQGRVKPTMQMKGMSINDNPALEKEADIMGAKAISTGYAGDLKNKNKSVSTGNKVNSLIQRKIENFPMPRWLLDLPSFRIAFDKTKVMSEAAILWAQEELRSVIEIIICSEELLARSGDIFGELGLLEYHINTETQEPGSIAEDFTRLALEIQQLTKSIFKLKSRQTQYRDSAEKGTYGYHMTKVHNLPSIRANGLDPGFGASDRGSVGMCTDDQLQGSIKSSKGVVAFADSTEIFSTYINQAEDRRQMIEGTPFELKAVMLRFNIKQVLDLDSIGYDIMEKRALNTSQKIPNDQIEVLTDNGWIALTSWTPLEPIMPLRDGDELRQAVNWGGEIPVLLKWDEIESGTNGAFDPLLAQDGDDRVAWLEAKRDKLVANHKGVKYTFRGATMQTSGHVKNWDYVFTVSDASGWLGRGKVRYIKEFLNPTMEFIREFRELL